MAVIIKGFDDVLKTVKEFEDAEFVSSITRQVASVALADMIIRVTDDGLAADGSKIGQYSTEPMYVSGSAIPPPKAPLTGIEGEAKKKNGQPYKSKYYASGYQGYKTEIGRNVLGSVNLSLKGTMIADFSLNNNFTDAPIQTSKGWGLGFRQTLNADILKGQEKKYKKAILSNITKDEEKHIVDFVNDYINDLFR